MPGLTAKVFRTYNASKTLQEQLEELTNRMNTAPINRTHASINRTHASVNSHYNHCQTHASTVLIIIIYLILIIV